MKVPVHYLVLRTTISPLSFSGSPLFFNAINYPDDFLRINFQKLP